MPVANDLAELLARLRSDPTATIDTLRFAAALRLEDAELAKQAGVHRSMVRAVPDHPLLQAYIHQALAVIGSVVELTNDLPRSVFWYRNEPIREFEFQSAEMLVARNRSDAVLSYLRTVANGSSG